jgi:hypothetical protein
VHDIASETSLKGGIITKTCHEINNLLKTAEMIQLNLENVCKTNKNIFLHLKQIP